MVHLFVTLSVNIIQQLSRMVHLKSKISLSMNVVIHTRQAGNFQQSKNTVLYIHESKSIQRDVSVELKSI